VEDEMKPRFRVGAWLAVCATMLTALPVLAADKPINISLFTPVSLAKGEDAVTAFRLNFIYGKNTSVKVVDLGLINQTTTASNGLQVGTINYNEGTSDGIQVAALNYDKGTTSGLQWGGINYAGSAGGLQLAVINYAEKLEGFQVGMLNIAKAGGRFPFMVIANWKK
jgi:hypothetical protein